MARCLNLIASFFSYIFSLFLCLLGLSKGRKPRYKFTPDDDQKILNVLYENRANQQQEPSALWRLVKNLHFVGGPAISAIQRRYKRCLSKLAEMNLSFDMFSYFQDRKAEMGL